MADTALHLHPQTIHTAASAAAVKESSLSFTPLRRPEIVTLRNGKREIQDP